jgi:two-component system LytT family sensor kinase
MHVCLLEKGRSKAILPVKDHRTRTVRPHEPMSIPPANRPDRPKQAGVDQGQRASPDARPFGLAGLWSRRWFRWLAITAGWTLVGFLSAAHWHYFYRGEDPYTWWQLLRIKIVLWYMWGGTTLLILWLGRRFRPEASNWLRRLGVLAGFSVVIVPAYLAAYTIAVLVHLGRPVMPVTWASMLQFVIAMHSTFFYLGYWATLGIQYAVDYAERYRRQELHSAQLNTQLAEAQLAALRARLQPHFLFNALNTVASMVLNNRRDEAYDTLAELAELLRMSLNHDASQLVTLEEELAFVDRYLNILKVRFADRLKVEKHVAAEALPLKVPSLILQPLVENAIKHGLDGTSRGVIIRIDACLQGSDVAIQIADDGPGLPQAFSLEQSEGLGLRSTLARLSGLYGANQQFAIGERPGGGTLVRLVIPASLDNGSQR